VITSLESDKIPPVGFKLTIDFILFRLKKIQN